MGYARAAGRISRSGCVCHRSASASNLAKCANLRRVLEHGADFAIIGRGAVLHHDFPQQVLANPHFEAKTLPVTSDYLRAEGLGPAFIGYMRTWKGFVAA